MKELTDASWQRWRQRIEPAMQALVPSVDATEPNARWAGEPFFGPYEILSQIGHGGVANVLRVRHVHPAFENRPTALKLLQAQRTDDERVVQLFRREAGVHSLIRHANIVETYESGVERGQPFLLMEFVLGGDVDHLLSRLRARGEVLAAELGVYIACEVLAGLGFAHQLRDISNVPLGLVHRDVNPANVFLSESGEVKIGDFGVASIIMHKRRHDAEVAGKAGYFAPEHLAGEAMDARADLFGAAVTLFELLAGRRLFQGDSEDAILAANARASVPDLEGQLPPAARHLAPILTQALSRRPRDRFADAAEFRDALVPHAAPAAAAKLTLTSMVQHHFEQELERERALRSAIRRRALPSLVYQQQFGRRPRVELDLESNDAHAAMTGLLEDLGYDAIVSLRSTRNPAHGHTEPPDHAATGVAASPSATPNSSTEASGRCPIAIVAVDDPPNVCDIARLESARRRNPDASLIVTAPAYSLAVAFEATQAKAVEIWNRPFRLHRVRRSLHDTLSRRMALYGLGDDAAASAPFGRAILAVGPCAHALLERNELSPSDRTLKVDSSAAALALCTQASFDIVVVDGEAVPDVQAFVAAFRQSVGVGLIPIVACQIDADAAPLHLGRIAVVAPGQSLPDAIEAASKGKAIGDLRAHTRFAARLPVSLRVGGRVIPAETVNVSRRGVLLASPFLPSIGTQMGLRIQLPASQAAPSSREVVVSARAQRAAVRKGDVEGGEFEGVQLGVLLGRFAGSAEAAWIAFIEQVAAQEPEANTLFERATRWLGGR